MIADQNIEEKEEIIYLSMNLITHCLLHLYLQDEDEVMQ